jgi:ubiquinone/menaquinone biosynthesis C-methylase UbiE
MKSNSNINNWKAELINDPAWDGVGIYNAQVNEALGTQFHDKMPKGAALREFNNVPLHLSYWETPYYKRAIIDFLQDCTLTSDSIALDIGCGDGRFAELLIEYGFNKVVAIDSHLAPLVSLQNYAEDQGYSEKLLLIHAGADCIPLPSGIATVSLAIGVFYYLNEKYEECLDEVARLLCSEGILINSEPDLEGAVLKSLYFENIEDALENYEAKRFKEEKGETEFKFRLFSERDICSLLNSHGFDVVGCHGLSLLPSILRIKMVRGECSEENVRLTKSRLRAMFNYFDVNGTAHKHKIWKSRKGL